jgi:hypothetical protein
MKTKKSHVLVVVITIVVILGFIFFVENEKLSPLKNAIEESFTRSGDAIVNIKKEINIDNLLVTVDILKINTAKAEIGITSPEILEKKSQLSGYNGYSLNEYAKLGNYKVIQSGGFLSSWSPPHPLGYVKIQGKEYNKVHKSWVTQGVFCTDGNSFTIEMYTTPNQFILWRSCIQAGPPIILNKKIILNTNRNTSYITKQKHRQSFLCKSSDGYLLMGIAEDVALNKLAPYLLKAEDNGGIGCVDAVLLTSKGISGILAKTQNIDLKFGNTDIPLPNAIVVK